MGNPLFDSEHSSRKASSTKSKFDLLGSEGLWPWIHGIDG
jgi:hypothetical protein